MSRRQDEKLSRRRLLELMGQGGLALAGAQMLNFVPGARAATEGRAPFLIYLHFGAYDGLAASLLQPKDVKTWQKGLFYKNDPRPSVNPNLNDHVKTGSLVFNAYNKFMAPIANHLCFTTGTPQSLDHFEAEAIQTSGTKRSGANPSWIAGFAQAVGQADDRNTLILTQDSTAADLGATVDRVNLAKAASIAELRVGFLDDASVPIGAYGKDGEAFWNAVAAQHGKRHGVGEMNGNLQQQYRTAVNTLITGVPELAVGSPLLASVESTITLAAVDAALAQSPDFAGIKARRNVNPFVRSTTQSFLLKQLQLAAALIKSGRASGMAIGAGQLGDLHAGGSSVVTAREASDVFAHLTVFWNWVKAEGLQDDVMVIVSHEFSRTPYNDTVGPELAVDIRNPTTNAVESVMVRSPGTDHQLAMGMMFLNGRVPPASRLGLLGDLYVPYGGTNLRGDIAADIPAYTATQLVTSMMMRCFPSLFPNERATRQVFPDLASVKPIDLLLA